MMLNLDFFRLIYFEEKILPFSNLHTIRNVYFYKNDYQIVNRTSMPPKLNFLPYSTAYGKLKFLTFVSQRKIYIEHSGKVTPDT